MGVKLGEVEFAGNQEDDGTDGSKSRVTPGFSLCGLEQAVDRFQEAVGLPGATQERMPSKWLRTSFATSFIGSTLDRSTLVHH